jgi:regulator of replication initiation timing
MKLSDELNNKIKAASDRQLPFIKMSISDAKKYYTRLRNMEQQEETLISEIDALRLERDTLHTKLGSKRPHRTNNRRQVQNVDMDGGKF